MNQVRSRCGRSRHNRGATRPLNDPYHQSSAPFLDQDSAQSSDEAYDSDYDDLNSQKETMDIESNSLNVHTFLIDALVENDHSGQKIFFQSIVLHLNDRKQVSIQDLINTLCRNQGQDLLDKVVMFWDFRRDVFLYVGEQEVWVDSEELKRQKQVYLKFRIRGISDDGAAQLYAQGKRGPNERIEEQKLQDDYESRNREAQTREAFLLQTIEEAKRSHLSCLNHRRVKERTIEFARSIVSEWRRVKENGVVDDNHNRIKITLDQAAQIVGVSRKTLDDYNLQIKKATEFGFDFDAHLKDKIGVLRRFNKMKELDRVEDADVEACDENNLQQLTKTERRISREEEMNKTRLKDDSLDFQYNRNEYKQNYEFTDRNEYVEDKSQYNNPCIQSEKNIWNNSESPNHSFSVYCPLDQNYSAIGDIALNSSPILYNSLSSQMDNKNNIAIDAEKFNQMSAYENNNNGFQAVSPKSDEQKVEMLQFSFRQGDSSEDEYAAFSRKTREDKFLDYFNYRGD